MCATQTRSICLLLQVPRTEYGVHSNCVHGTRARVAATRSLRAVWQRSETSLAHTGGGPAWPSILRTHETSTSERMVSWSGGQHRVSAVQLPSQMHLSQNCRTKKRHYDVDNAETLFVQLASPSSLCIRSTRRYHSTLKVSPPLPQARQPSLLHSSQFWFVRIPSVPQPPNAPRLA